MLRTRTRIIAVLSSALLVGLATQVARGYDLLTASTIEITHSGDLPSSSTCASVTEPEERLVIQRGALQPDLEVSVTATLTLQLTGVLNSFKLKAGTDADGDKIIEASEWQTIASGTIQVSGGVTTATIGPVDVDIDADVYRLEQNRSDFGTVWEEWLVDSDYTTDDWTWVESE